MYLYNPLRPVPTVGGQVILPGGNAIGPRDQSEVELRDDVLVYSTPKLEEAVEVTGPIELRLFASCSATRSGTSNRASLSLARSGLQTTPVPFVRQVTRAAESIPGSWGGGRTGAVAARPARGRYPGRHPGPAGQ